MTWARNAWKETYNKWLTKIIFIRFTTTIYKKIQELFEIHMLLEVLISQLKKGTDYLSYTIIKSAEVAHHIPILPMIETFVACFYNANNPSLTIVHTSSRKLNQSSTLKAQPLLPRVFLFYFHCFMTVSKDHEEKFIILHLISLVVANKLLLYFPFCFFCYLEITKYSPYYLLPS